jgi:preprotein translocase subunit SecE
VARNRKRAKERRSRRQTQPSISRRGLATAGAEPEEAAPDPLEHAAPDVELADAQIALGRPDFAEQPEADEEELEELEREAAVPTAITEDGDSVRGGAVAPAATHVAEPRPRVGNRLINFLQGSWRELQRVQWPDRRQVVQATGVVIGFVIVAGVFLGVADTLAAKLMNFILK